MGFSAVALGGNAWIFLAGWYIQSYGVTCYRGELARVEAPVRFFAQVASNAWLCFLVSEADFI